MSMPTPQPFSLDQSSVALEWHEAVAVVQEVATRYLAGEGVMARRASDLSVDAEGRLTIPRAKVSVFGKGVSATVNEAQHVSDLRALLKDLLGTTAVPPALGALLDAAPGSAQATSVTEFSKALAFFERPGRARDLKIMASRQAAVHEQLTLNEKLAELTRKARHEHEPDQPLPTASPALAAPLRVVQPSGAQSDDPGWEFLSEAELRGENQPAEAPPKRGLSLPAISVAQLKQIGLLVSAIALLIVAGVVAYYAFTAMTSGVTTRSDSASGGVSAQSTARNGSDALRPELGRSSKVASAGQGRGSSRTAQPKGSAARSNSALVRGSSRSPAERNDAGLSVVPALPPSDGPALALGPLLHVAPRNTALARMPTFLASGRVDATLVGLDQVFDAGDDKVRPARLLRPQLPEIPPGTPLEALGMFEFVVNARGTVDRIRLVRSPVDRQYRDFMLMPAAKAWIFYPAMKDGSPVRYRLQIPIPQ